MHQWISGADGPARAGGRGSHLLDDELGGPHEIGRLDDIERALRVHQDLHGWVFRPDFLTSRGLNLVWTSRSPATARMRVPGSNARAFTWRGLGARQTHSAMCSSGTPMRYAVLRPSAGRAGTDARLSCPRPLQRLARVARRAHDPTARAAERLDGALEFMYVWA